MLVRRSLGMLCSETDGLPKKYRIVFEPDRQNKIYDFDDRT